MLARRFSTEKPVVLPTKVFDRHDLLMTEFEDCQSMALHAFSENRVLELFQDYGDRMPAEVLGDLSESILAHKVHLSQEFNKKVAPIIAAYISKMTRDHSWHFGRMLRDFALMEIDSPMIWDALWNTYRIENMHRYIPISILCDTIINIAAGKMRPLELFETALPVLSKHRHRLSEEQLDALLESLQQIQAEEPRFQTKNLLGYFEREAPTLAKSH
jgi:hypothetical protein